MFAKSIKELIATSAKNKAAAAKAPKSAKAPASKASLQDVEKALGTKKGHERWAVLREFHKSEYGLEALPMLRRLLAEDDVSMVDTCGGVHCQAWPRGGDMPRRRSIASRCGRACR